MNNRLIIYVQPNFIHAAEILVAISHLTSVSTEWDNPEYLRMQDITIGESLQVSGEYSEEGLHVRLRDLVNEKEKLIVTTTLPSTVQSLINLDGFSKPHVFAFGELDHISDVFAGLKEVTIHAEDLSQYPGTPRSFAYFLISKIGWFTPNLVVYEKPKHQIPWFIADVY